MDNEKKYFPIQTDTSCSLKWNWSTLYLNSGKTASCHRTAFSDITAENFFDFHNTPLKVSDRQAMLRGEWPEHSCEYCKKIENAGGFSDRMLHLTIPDLIPTELATNTNAVLISPTILEVFFNNTCNLGCLYCHPSLSSKIETENQNFGNFEKQGVKLFSHETKFKDLIPHFWEWFPTGFHTIKRFHFMGGEPFYQKEFDKLLDMIEEYPNPDCVLNIVTNLMVPKKRIEGILARLKELLIARKLKGVDISCSIDCWGPQQEYVRWGLDLNQWEDNFKLLIENKWIRLGISQTISTLTIKTMPELLLKLTEWRKDRKIGHWLSGVTPGPDYLKGEIFGDLEFKDAVASILPLMPLVTDDDKTTYEYMQGTLTQITSSTPNYEEIKNLIIFLNEKDRRRKTNWHELFPWLIKYEALCGITK
jgi:pyruvate-formate lyase-activating enzyme